ncbi:GtrA family protein [Lacticaseibacillus kribbianus]|uniref:GtrA family protein n=1 Tax=Lacticaseibacillus kribbianus TaxID=2926292 RepID=UPI001CD4B004|nr:GtrA family protein [Lacticaseibacillus kribbianus]
MQAAIRRLFTAHRELLLYLWFGGLTTLVNVAIFALFDRGLHLGWTAANAWAWIAAVAFAFVTNRRYVFGSAAAGVAGAWWELAKFVAARLASLGLDYPCMWALISGLSAGSLVAKLVTQVVVVVANLALSKWLVFASRK